MSHRLQFGLVSVLFALSFIYLLETQTRVWSLSAGDQLTRERAEREPDTHTRSRSRGLGASCGLRSWETRSEVIKRTLYGAITDIMTPRPDSADSR